MFKPLVASCISVGGAFALYLYIYRYTHSVLIAFGAAILLALIMYIWLSFMTGSLTKNDVMLLPFGERVISFMDIRKNKRLTVSDGTEDGGEKNDCCRKEKDAFK